MRKSRCWRINIVALRIGSLRMALFKGTCKGFYSFAKIFMRFLEIFCEILLRLIYLFNCTVFISEIY